MKLSDLTSTEQVNAEALENGCCATGWSTTCRGPSWAAGSGVSQPYVAKLERGDQAPSLATLARLAQRLGLEFPIAITPTTVRLSP